MTEELREAPIEVQLSDEDADSLRQAKKNMPKSMTPPQLGLALANLAAGYGMTEMQERVCVRIMWDALAQIRKMKNGGNDQKPN